MDGEGDNDKPVNAAGVGSGSRVDTAVPVRIAGRCCRSISNSVEAPHLCFVEPGGQVPVRALPMAGAPVEGTALRNRPTAQAADDSPCRRGRLGELGVYVPEPHRLLDHECGVTCASRVSRCWWMYV